MRTPIPSYAGHTFTVTDNLALVRDPQRLDQVARFTRKDELPPGMRVGDQKVIPMMTQVTVTGVRTDAGRNVYVFAVPANEDSSVPSGWTVGTNLDGDFLNELSNYAPADWDVLPGGRAFTVTDPNALIRGKGPRFRSKGTTIDPGTRVVVTKRSTETDPAGKFVRVSNGVLVEGQVRASGRIGWTDASNLAPGWSSAYTSDAWADDKGPNACWRSGQFIGSKILVDIVGTGGQMEQITLDSAAAYFKLQAAAARRNVDLGIVSGFRTFAAQKRLHDLFVAGTGNLAARPGTSNHQHGQAFDLNTTGFDGTRIYDWLKKRGPRLGFVRTVSGEHWHWEYRPDDARRLAAVGEFKLEGVTP